MLPNYAHNIDRLECLLIVGNGGMYIPDKNNAGVSFYIEANPFRAAFDIQLHYSNFFADQKFVDQCMTLTDKLSGALIAMDKMYEENQDMILRNMHTAIEDKLLLLKKGKCY